MTVIVRSRRPQPIRRELEEYRTGPANCWIHYGDENGREHREKASSRAAAVALYRKRMSQIEERRLLRRAGRFSASQRIETPVMGAAL